MDDLRPWHPLRRLLTARPYLTDGDFTHTENGDFTVVYHYAVDADERVAIASAQLGQGLPPLRWVRAWIDDWERYLRTPTRTPTTGRAGRPQLEVTGLLEEHHITVRALPGPAQEESTLHPLMAALVDIRHARRITQAAAARRSGYGTTTLWRWETGHRDPTLSQVADYAQLLGYTLTLTPIDPTDPGEDTQ